jgi:hypothetical protein
MTKKEKESIVVKLAYAMMHANLGDTPHMLRDRVMRGMNSEQKKEFNEYLDAESKTVVDVPSGKIPAAVREEQEKAKAVEAEAKAAEAKAKQNEGKTE